MRVAILGLGVIGTTYAYTFQRAGHQVKRVLRDSRRNNTPKSVSVNLLDGRYNSKGESKHSTCEVQAAGVHSEYDFIFLNVRYGFVKGATRTLREDNIKGTLVSFCNFQSTREGAREQAGEYDHVLAFPIADERMTEDRSDGVLFDHLMLEGEQRAKVLNYVNLTISLTFADLKWEVPHNMVEWIRIHMAINAGATSTATCSGKLENPEELTLNLMNSSSELSLAIKTIQKALKVIKVRGVNLKLYKAGLLPYRILTWLAGRAMKVMFVKDEIT